MDLLAKMEIVLQHWVTRQWNGSFYSTGNQTMEWLAVQHRTLVTRQWFINQTMEWLVLQHMVTRQQNGLLYSAGNQAEWFILQPW